MAGPGAWWTGSGPEQSSEARKVHYGCQEFREDGERIIQGRGHPQLEQLYHAHLAICGDCQRYHHRLEAVYITPDVVAQRCAVLRMLDLRSGERVIDIGCGTGLLAADLALTVGDSGRVLGVDLSSDTLALARRRCAAWPWVELLEGDATALPGGDRAFDVAVSTQVLEYVPDVDRALREIVCNLGGVSNGFPREAGFDITVASEVMAILCLATDLRDLEKRLGDIIVAYRRDRSPVFARDLKAVGDFLHHIG